MMRAFLPIQFLLVAVLLLSCCATQRPKSLENETGEAWSCHGALSYEEFYAVVDETAGTGYILFRKYYYKSNFQKVRKKHQKILAESIKTGYELREWHFQKAMFRIHNDGAEPGFAGTLLPSGNDLLARKMRCTKDR